MKNSGGCDIKFRQLFLLEKNVNLKKNILTYSVSGGILKVVNNVERNVFHVS